MKPIKYNFIVGIGRSGTTLLMSMLNAHPLLQGTPEVNFFNFFYNSWKNKNSFHEKDFNDLDVYIEGLRARNQSSGFSWDGPAFRKKIESLKEINFKKIYDAFYASFVYNNTSKDITHNFDKNPINTLFLADLIKTFPDAKFIFLVRDPRANFLSRKEKFKKRRADIYLDTQRWKLYNEKAWSVIKNQPSRFFILKYEDLVTNPEIKLKELSDFFGFAFDEKILNFHEEVKQVSLKNVEEGANENDPKLLLKYEKLSKPINTDRLNAWREKLTEDETNICAKICAGTAKHFGYNIDRKPVSINFFKYYKGLAKAKADYIKNLLLYYAPLSIKISRVKKA